MTPAEVARVALRLADALYAMAEEMRRPDPCAAIVSGDRGCALDLAASLALVVHRDECPQGARLALIMASLITRAAGADGIDAWADAWRTWGEARRAALAPCPVCEEPKGEVLCADTGQRIDLCGCADHYAFRVEEARHG